jgi:hypothetical protein
MKKINKFLEKNIILIFTIFLFIQPVLDIITGVMLYTVKSTFTLSSLIRVIFMFFMIYYILFVKKTKFKKLLFFIFGYSIIFIFVNIMFKSNCNIISEIKNLLNNIYLPISIIFIIEMLENNNFEMKKIYIILLIYLLLVFIPNLLGLGFNSYAYSKEGSVGFFYSANAVGSIISIIVPLFIYELIKNKNKIYLVLFLIMYLYVLLTLGTKAPILCALIILIYYILLFIVNLIKNKSYKKLILLFLILIIFSIVLSKIIVTTPFYDNLLIHLRFLKIKKLSDLFTFKNIDHFIFSSRLSFFYKSFKIYISSNILQKLFGIGYVINDKTIKLAEMDYLDMFIHQGIIGFVLIYYIYFKLIIDMFKNYFKKFKSNFLNSEKSLMIISIIISILCALLTGHVLATPAVSIYVSLIIVIYYKKLKLEE